ncbi:trypsin-like peptidase domain-containing protein [Sagittula salina]|uniref:Trypsin-like peptidase domain-containing protein n=1 Tax=Sagittula salina TaxID=2820268 RepID=A0A940MSK4_9RHOB|nr:trypsin-like peptidase domain-containing protein [Sagittula salina]MBP0482219.1 trypsin-like peptidase domain-containing protein [Sagittula salina]
MPLPFQDLNALHAALLQAFRNRAEFEMFLMRRGRVYEDLTGAARRDIEFFNILVEANAKGWLGDLARALSEDPGLSGNAALTQAAESLLAKLHEPQAPALPDTALPPARVSDAAKARADSHDEDVQDALQRIVDKINPYVDAVAVLQRLARTGCHTGRVEAFGGTQGSCLLVGPDLVLTNHHVMSPLKPVEAGHLAVRFDFYKDEHGIVHDGFTVGMTADWLVLDSPPAPSDFSNDPDDEATADHLDYALVRLAEDVGIRPCHTALGGGTGGRATGRGWTTLDTDAPCPQRGAYLTIVQHPVGAPRKSTPGKVLSYGPSARRIRYDANTEVGSSGSPVLNGEGRLCALHHSGDPNFDLNAFNQGIPIGLIAADIAARGVILQAAS